ncbi:MAG: 4Fe-4S dicluster domain-containing protein [Rhodospirillales bacterium]
MDSIPESGPALSWATIEAAVGQAGLTPRGAIAYDRPPDPAEGLAAETRWLLLLGAVGGSIWPTFSAAPEVRDGAANPLDRWSRRVIEGLAGELGAAPLFPFGGPPFLPFQRWAKLAEGLQSSPLGLLIHPRHGLWHAYRGALAFGAVPDDWQPEAAPAVSPCESCETRPCLSACPVSAFSSTGYDVAACQGHLRSDAGQPCMTGSCLARRACPVAADLAYSPAQMGFHMQAFRGANEPKVRE